MRKVIIPGSYDPISLGHLNIIERSSKLFDYVYVIVGINVDKTYMFTDKQRLELTVLACSHLNNVEVLFNDGLTIDKANKLDASYIVKGIRNNNDLIYEYKQMKINEELNPNIKTLFLKADPKYDNISSTLIREYINSNLDISSLVPNNIIDKINEYKRINKESISFEITDNKTVTKEDTLEVFDKLRIEAKNNNIQDMSLEEIEKEITLNRKGK